MTSKRMTAKKANRWPYWTRRVSEAKESGAAGAATQWDLARTYISKLPLAGDRDAQWRALGLTIAAFNTRFTGESATAVLDTEGRNAGAERVVKSMSLAALAAYHAYDTARKYLRRIEDETQEEHWRALETTLREFNERFGRDPTRAIARMATTHNHPN